MKRMVSSFAVVVSLMTAGAVSADGGALEVKALASYRTGLFDRGAAEIPAFDPVSKRLFVVNGASNEVDVLDIADPGNPRLAFSIPLTDYGASPTSVSVHDGMLAVAVVADPKTAPGRIAFFDVDGRSLGTVESGALPDMVTFTPDGRRVLAANEGEPSDDYQIDPEGSVTIIELADDRTNIAAAHVTTAGFGDFEAELPGMRLFGPRATFAQDVEPEYIAVSPDSTRAWVTLQENNAIAEVDLLAGEVSAIHGLGWRSGVAFDASDKDGAVNFRKWPVFGMYQPDTIASYTTDGGIYLLTANEGDSRDYDGFSEEARVADLRLDPAAFPDAEALQDKRALGRLKVTTTEGDDDRDGDYDALYAYGTRSFSIWKTDGTLVYDSGDEIERMLAERFPDDFNSNSDENGSFDDRSDDKGPEPEGIAVGIVDGIPYAFVGLERMGGVVVYDISDVTRPRFVDYVENRNFSGDPKADTAGDLAPEGLLFVSADESPDGTALLVAANEVSGSVTLYRLAQAATN